MWTYKQSTGEIFDKDNKFIGTGYSGNGDGKNNPDMEGILNTGPIPQGVYSIGKGINNPRTGPMSLPLTPKNTNNIYGRSQFYIHGDSISDPGNGSDGCICAENSIRTLIDSSKDKRLNVTE